MSLEEARKIEDYDELLLYINHEMDEVENDLELKRYYKNQLHGEIDVLCHQIKENTFWKCMLRICVRLGSYLSMNLKNITKLRAR